MIRDEAENLMEFAFAFKRDAQRHIRMNQWHRCEIVKAKLIEVE